MCLYFWKNRNTMSCFQSYATGLANENFGSACRRFFDRHRRGRWPENVYGFVAILRFIISRLSLRLMSSVHRNSRPTVYDHQMPKNQRSLFVHESFFSPSRRSLTFRFPVRPSLEDSTVYIVPIKRVLVDVQRVLSSRRLILTRSLVPRTFPAPSNTASPLWPRSARWMAKN